MRTRNVFAGLLIALVSFTLSARVVAQGTWAVEKTFHIGGEGGMDYVTLDAQDHRLYIPRSTHTMVIDADSGKPLADIPGQKHNHGVALVPGAGRGFIDARGAGIACRCRFPAASGLFCGGTQWTALAIRQLRSVSPSSGRASYVCLRQSRNPAGWNRAGRRRSRR